MKSYYVKYRLHGKWPKGINILANNKYDAYIKAIGFSIPEKEGEMPYSAWVESVTYSNGNYKLFNTFEGNPY